MNKIFLKFFGLRIYTCIQIPRHYIHDFFHAHHVYYVICITHIHPLLYSCSWHRILPRMLYLLQEINCVALLKKQWIALTHSGTKTGTGHFGKPLASTRLSGTNTKTPLTFAVKTVPDCTSSVGSLPNYLVVSTICVHQVNIKPPLIFTSQRNSVFFFISYY